MKGYLALIKASVLVNLAYRGHFFFTLAGSILGMVLQYFLWKAIYAGAAVMNGMTFNQTFTWVALSSTAFTTFVTYVDWDMCYSVIDGIIATDLIRPTDYQLFMLTARLGTLALNLVIVVLPSILVLTLVFKASIPVGINLAFFAVSLVLSFLMSYTMEFIIGLLSFKTNSVWGISEAKNVLVRVLSGSVVPLAFFPGWLRSVADVLPFRAMYDVPMRILLYDGADAAACLRGLGLQLAWCLVVGALSRLMLSRSLKSVNVSGG